jgi:hypothetical protein
LGDKGKIFLSDIIEIKGRKEMIEKVEREVRDYNAVRYK